MNPRHPYQAVIEIEVEADKFTPCLVLRELPLNGGAWELLVQLPDGELMYVYATPR